MHACMRYIVLSNRIRYCTYLSRESLAIPGSSWVIGEPNSTLHATSLRTFLRDCVQLPEAISILVPATRIEDEDDDDDDEEEEGEAGGYTRRATRAYKHSRHEIRWESASGARLMLSTRTHTSRRARILCSRPPSVQRDPPAAVFGGDAALDRVARLSASTCVRARVLYMGPPVVGVQCSAVVPGGIRDDTSPMSLHRLGMSGRMLRLATHRWTLVRFIRACRYD